ncbi:MAG: tyrosine-type recombinase/integrase [Xanthobacteraceae bacterium]
MALTDTAIKNAKPGAKVVKISDGGGLQLWITPAGGKFWHFAYRFDGKQKRLALGEYGKAPAGTPLETARKRRDEAKGLLAQDVDPAIHRERMRADRAEARFNTFNVLADEYVAKKRRDGRDLRTLEKTEWVLRYARPFIGERPINTIGAADVLATLQPLEAAGKLDAAHRLRSTIGGVFRYAIATARATSDPTLALRGAIASKSKGKRNRAAVTDPVAFGGLLRAVDGYLGQPTTKAALQLVAMLACRPGELRHATWAEFDLNGGVWNVPAERMKMRRPHRVPLPAQAVAILKALHPITGHGAGGLVFPGLRSVKRPISENTMNGALRRIGFSQDEATAHGFRSTFSTLANDSGKWSVNAIEAALAHIEPNAVRRAYARGDYWDERVKLMTWWADYLDTLRTGAKVLPFKETGNGAG